MNKAKFTGGKWRVERFVNDKGFEIAFNDDGEVVADYVYTEHDAHLIAAAPEMYKLLLQLQVEGGLGVARHRQVGRILAKARGEHE